MTQIQTLLTGALLVIAGALFANGIHPAAAYANGPFVLRQHSNTAANAGVFRLDTSTGEVSYCFLAGNSASDLVCGKAVR